MSVLNPVAIEDDQDLKTEERTEHRSLSVAEMRAHFLVPGDLCVCLDDPNPKDGTLGVVVNSAENNDHAVEVMFGREPIRRFSRARLLWYGPIG